jgi:Zn-dependent protease
MHAYVGYKLGDTTARDEGRLSFNPIKHIDPIMTIALPVITFLLFKAPILVAKPVPFTPWLVRYREKGVALLSIAGPLSNLVLAALAAVVARSVPNSSLLYQILFYFSQLNIGLFLFNLIPLPPLDGSRVLYAFVPQPVRDLMDQIEPYGFFLIFAIVALGGFGGVLSNFYNFFMNILF